MKRLSLIGLLLLSSAGPASAQLAALPGLKSAARAAPKDAQAQRRYGLGLIRAGRYDEAERQMQVLVRLEGESLASLFELARVRFEEGNYRRARGACRALVLKDPDHVLSQVCMARAFLAWRRASRADEYLDKALVAAPDDYEALLALGDARRMQGKEAESLAAYRKAIEVNPKSAAARLGIGRLHRVNGRRAEAVEALEEALTLDPDDPELQFELGRLASGTRAVELLGAALAGRGEWPEAYLALGHARLANGDLQGARTIFEQVLKKKEDGGAKLGLGEILLTRNELAAAEPVLKRAAELLPGEKDAALALARLYAATERVEEALAEYQRAASLDLKDPEPLIAAARLAEQERRTLLSSAFLRKAIERAPRHAQALAMLAEQVAERGDKARAREYYERALQGEGELDRNAVGKRLADLK